MISILFIIDRQVVVDIFLRKYGPEAGTYFLRVSLRSMMNKMLIMRYEIDLDKHTNESAFLKEVEVGAGTIAERDCDVRGATWDCEWVAKQACDAAKELLHDINNQ